MRSIIAGIMGVVIFTALPCYGVGLTEEQYLPQLGEVPSDTTDSLRPVLNETELNLEICSGEYNIELPEGKFFLPGDRGNVEEIDSEQISVSFNPGRYFLYILPQREDVGAEPNPFGVLTTRLGEDKVRPYVKINGVLFEVVGYGKDWKNWGDTQARIDDFLRKDTGVVKGEWWYPVYAMCRGIIGGLWAIHVYGTKTEKIYLRPAGISESTSDPVIPVEVSAFKGIWDKTIYYYPEVRNITQGDGLEVIRHSPYFYEVKNDSGSERSVDLNFDSLKGYVININIPEGSSFFALPGWKGIEIARSGDEVTLTDNVTGKIVTLAGYPGCYYGVQIDGTQQGYLIQKGDVYIALDSSGIISGIYQYSPELEKEFTFSWGTISITTEAATKLSPEVIHDFLESWHEYAVSEYKNISFVNFLMQLITNINVVDTISPSEKVEWGFYSFPDVNSLKIETDFFNNWLAIKDNAEVEDVYKEFSKMLCRRIFHFSPAKWREGVPQGGYGTAFIQGAMSLIAKKIEESFSKLQTYMPIWEELMPPEDQLVNYTEGTDPNLGMLSPHPVLQARMTAKTEDEKFLSMLDFNDYILKVWDNIENYYEYFNPLRNDPRYLIKLMILYDLGLTPLNIVDSGEIYACPSVFIRWLFHVLLNVEQTTNYNNYQALKAAYTAIKGTVQNFIFDGLELNPTLKYFLDHYGWLDRIEEIKASQNQQSLPSDISALSNIEFSWDKAFDVITPCWEKLLNLAGEIYFERALLTIKDRTSSWYYNIPIYNISEDGVITEFSLPFVASDLNSSSFPFPFPYDDLLNNIRVKIDKSLNKAVITASYWSEFESKRYDLQFTYQVTKWKQITSSIPKGDNITIYLPEEYELIGYGMCW